MTRLTDRELVEELKKRFKENKKALHDLRGATKQLEIVNKKLKESEALKSNFLSNVRNEINNPLTSILGLSRQLLSGMPLDGEEISAVANLIHTEAFNLDFQLRNIFAAAEIEAGENDLSISDVDVVGLISNTVDSFRHMSDGRGLKVDFSHEPADEAENGLSFNTDPEKLQIVLSNLLCNAIEFNLDGGRVTIKAWKLDDQLNISVIDTCTGIGNSEKAAIFDRFKQLDTGVRKSHRGHGLGLTITKAMVELLSGTISFSTKKGKGCTFTVTIPEAKSDKAVDIFSDNGNEFIFEAEREF